MSIKIHRKTSFHQLNLWLSVIPAKVEPDNTLKMFQTRTPNGKTTDLTSTDQILAGSHTIIYDLFLENEVSTYSCLPSELLLNPANVRTELVNKIELKKNLCIFWREKVSISLSQPNCVTAFLLARRTNLLLIFANSFLSSFKSKNETQNRSLWIFKKNPSFPHYSHNLSS